MNGRKFIGNVSTNQAGRLQDRVCRETISQLFRKKKSYSVAIHELFLMYVEATDHEKMTMKLTLPSKRYQNITA
jgi:hypothetical protein